MKTYKSCQSCGMPMSRDDKGGGTNADGSKGAMYEFGIPGFVSRIFTRKIPGLERWSA